MFNINNPVVAALSKLWDLIVLNILVLVFCIPIFTAGAAFTSMYTVTMQMVKNEEETSIAKMFFKNFKRFFKKSTVLWCIQLMTFGFIWADFAIMKSSRVFLLILTVACIICVFIMVYANPLLVIYDDCVIKTIKNALFISIMYLPRTLIIIAIYTVWIYMIGVSLGLFVPMLALMGFTLPAYFSSYQYIKAFDIRGNLPVDK